MFAAMLFAIPLFWVGQMLKPKREREWPEFRVLVKMLVPSTFDMLGTALSQAGLLYTTASMFQLLRCSVIIITAILKIILFGERLAGYMWAGVVVNTIAMALVGSTSFMEDESGGGVLGSDPKLGFFLIMLSVVVQGAQYVFEEKVMANDNCPPLMVIGMEGFWGVLLTFFIAFPVAYILPGNDYGGSFESAYDAWVMWMNDGKIRLLVCLFFVSITGYNVMSIYVTKLLSSIWHAILDNFRPVSVWMFGLLIYYSWSDGTMGEAWGTYSFLQLAGMLLLFVGTAIYNGSVPCCLFGLEGYTALEGVDKHMRTPGRMTTPTLMRSPMLTKAINTPDAAAAARAQRELEMQNDGFVKPAKTQSFV